MPTGEFDFGDRGPAGARDEARTDAPELELLDAHVDTAAEVDAVFRSQRRLAIGYFCIFLALTFGVAVANVALGWWTDGRVLGGLSPGFVAAGLGLYVVFTAIVVAAATLSNSTEDQMLGSRSELEDVGRWDAGGDP